MPRAFGQLFFVFAPVAFFARLFRDEWIAAGLTVIFAVCIAALKLSSLKSPLPPGLLAELLAVRGLAGALIVFFYLRGGVILVWWIGLLMQARHLL